MFVLSEVEKDELVEEYYVANGDGEGDVGGVRGKNFAIEDQYQVRLHRSAAVVLDLA